MPDLSIILKYNHFNLISYGTNYGEFYEYIDVVEISDSVGELMSGESGRITRVFDRKRDTMVIY